MRWKLNKMKKKVLKLQLSLIEIHEQHQQSEVISNCLI